ncbi:MAG: hypothetical protein WCP35_15605 [Verrucomicrobiota bacterium]
MHHSIQRPLFLRSGKACRPGLSLATISVSKLGNSKKQFDIDKKNVLLNT